MFFSPKTFHWSIFSLNWESCWKEILSSCTLHCECHGWRSSVIFVEVLVLATGPWHQRLVITIALPYKEFCVFCGLKSYCFFSVAISSQSPQLFLFSEKWLSFDFLSSITTEVLALSLLYLQYQRLVHKVWGNSLYSTFVYRSHWPDTCSLRYIVCTFTVIWHYGWKYHF